jgi:hypothetical protein
MVANPSHGPGTFPVGDRSCAEPSRDPQAILTWKTGSATRERAVINYGRAKRPGRRGSR